MKEKIIEIEENLKTDLEKLSSVKEINDIRVKYFGKKGLVTELKNSLSDMSNDEKKEFGKLYNDFKNEASELLDKKRSYLEVFELEKKLSEEKIDVTLSATRIKTGSEHPLSMIIEEIEELFISMGYDVVSGPEIESDLYNFERLNLPKDHPARDMQDSLYITEEMLLRTQTSPAQARVMEANVDKTPIRVICPGKVYRKDDDDATHSHQFTQIEGLVVDKGISVAHLKGTLELLAKKLFGENREIRFRPSYFPFTEPSLEVDVSCFKCGGSGCSICKESGWIEILGSGMVHPEVLRMGGYDPEVYSGFAFGMGPDRVAMLKYGIADIRQLYTNNVEFLETFKRIEKGDENEVK